MAAVIEVKKASDGNPVELDVRVREGGGESRHRVTLGKATLAQLGGGDEAALVEAAFRFLLDREPKESILSRFDLTVIERYFPEFPREIARYRAGDGR